jgi:Flp pilus assembly protein TadG
MKRRSRHGAGEKGATIVEFVMIAVLLFMLLFGIMDFGRAIYTYLFVGYAAREGTRWAIVRGSGCSGCTAGASDVETYVKGLAIVGIDPTKITVTTTWPNGDNKAGSPVSVHVQYSFQFIVPLMSSSGIPMQSTSQMVISQ